MTLPIPLVILLFVIVVVAILGTMVSTYLHRGCKSESEYWNKMIREDRRAEDRY